MSAAAPDDALVAALARAGVEGAAPEELPLFRAMSDAYARDPESLAQRRSGDDVLGFGVDVALTLVTPVALAVARDVVAFVTEQLRERAREEGEGLIDRLFRRLTRRDEEAKPATAPLLSREQLAQVRALALQKALQLKLPTAKAELLADSLAGSLATA